MQVFLRHGGMGVAAVLALIGVFVSVVLGVGWIQRSRERGELENERRLAAEAGLPLSPRALTPEPPVPDSENAAILLRRAHENFRGEFGKRLTDAQKRRKAAWDAFDAFFARTTKVSTMQRDSRSDEELSKRIAALAPELDLARQASLRPKLDFRRPWEQGLAVLFPELASIKGFVRALGLNAQSEAHQGRKARALAELLAAARISNLLRQEPDLISRYVSIATGKIVLRCLQHNVFEDPGDAFWLDKSEEVLEALGPPIDLRPAVGAELVCSLVSLDWLATEEGMKSVGFDEGDIRRHPTRVASRDATEIVLLRESRKILAAWPNDPFDYEAVRTAVRGKENRVQEALANYSEAFRLLGSGTGEEEEGVFEMAANACGEWLTQQRVFKATLAALRFKREKGIFPATLPLEGPDAADPFDEGKPLKYRHTAKGFVVYGVGRDGMDDGGRARGEGAGDGYDVVIAFPAN